MLLYLKEQAQSIVVKYQVESRVEKQNNRPEGQVIYPSTSPPHSKQVSVDMELIMPRWPNPRPDRASFFSHIR